MKQQLAVRPTPCLYPASPGLSGLPNVQGYKKELDVVNKEIDVRTALHPSWPRLFRRHRGD